MNYWTSLQKQNPDGFELLKKDFEEFLRGKKKK